MFGFPWLLSLFIAACSVWALLEVIRVVRDIRRTPRRRRPIVAPPSPDAVPAALPEPMAPSSRPAPLGDPEDLARRIETFRKIGLTLSPGITPDDLLISWDEALASEVPWWQLYFIYGNEVEAAPWGRRVSPHVWTLDMEFIEGPDSYRTIVAELLALTGRPDLFRVASVEFSASMSETGPVVVTLTGAAEIRLTGVLTGDWADPDIVEGVMRAIEAALGDGRRFRAGDNGQAMILSCLTDAQADALHALDPDLLTLAAPA